MIVADLLRNTPLVPLDAQVLLSAILEKDRSWLLSHPEDIIAADQHKKWTEWERRRLESEPVAYILGIKEFYSRQFQVSPAVLIPRPATEHLIDVALQFIDNPQDQVTPIDTDIIAIARVLKPQKVNESIKHIADIGTGSGCIAITLALEKPGIDIIATDISADALEVAKKNAHALGADRIHFEKGEGTEPLRKISEPFIIVSNPPYIPENLKLEKDVANHEPHMALFAGTKGTDVIEQIIQGAMEHPHCQGFLFECRADQQATIDSRLGRR